MQMSFFACGGCCNLLFINMKGSFPPFTDENAFCVLALLRYEVLIGGSNLMSTFLIGI